MAHGVVIRLCDAKSPTMSVHISKSFVNFLSDWCTVLLCTLYDILAQLRDELRTELLHLNHDHANGHWDGRWSVLCLTVKYVNTQRCVVVRLSWSCCRRLSAPVLSVYTSRYQTRCRPAINSISCCPLVVGILWIIHCTAVVHFVFMTIAACRCCTFRSPDNITQLESPTDHFSNILADCEFSVGCYLFTVSSSGLLFSHDRPSEQLLSSYLLPVTVNFGLYLDLRIWLR